MQLIYTRLPAGLPLRKRIIIMNAIPPEAALDLSIAAWAIAVILLYPGIMMLKKKGISSILMCFHRFFIQGAAF
jgi:hypothetical protein